MRHYDLRCLWEDANTGAVTCGSEWTVGAVAAISAASGFYCIRTGAGIATLQCAIGAWRPLTNWKVLHTRQRVMTRNEPNITEDDHESSSYCSECSADHGQETDKDEDSDDEITRDKQDHDVNSGVIMVEDRDCLASACGR
jgi:hypothetical protein